MAPPTPGLSPDASSSKSLAPKSQRVLACILCQQRKVKCDRRFPCANCIKAHTQCVPATLTQRRRKRRFPERELLDRLRKYEDLLRQHNIPFEPLHKDAAAHQDIPAEGVSDSDDEHTQATKQDSAIAPTSTTSDRLYGSRDASQFRELTNEPLMGAGGGLKKVFHIMNQGFRDPGNESDSSQDDVRENVVRTAWDQSIGYNDNLLFGSRDTSVDLSTLHPDPIQIFRLWQIYLDNVNPILKVTHTPTLQARIIEAASNMNTINPTLEALMFSIYCISILSLSEEDCQTMFGSPKEDLLTRYQFGCQQALLNSSFLRSSDRDCLTALLLYLISARPNTIPQSLSSVLGVAIRLAQRIGVHSESHLAKQSVLEAEMGRRLWWSLVLFDSRISEISTSNTYTLDPTWDTKVPLNVSDSDLRPEMKETPTPYTKASEAVFLVVRCEIGDYKRHSLNFVNPRLQPLSKNYQNGQSISEEDTSDRLEKMLEDKYFKSCDPETPIHFMTIWTTREWVAKRRLMDQNVKYIRTSTRPTDAQRDTALSYALEILECNTKVMTSPLVKGFAWFSHFNFPMPAYFHLVQDLKRRPLADKAAYAWEVLSENYDAWYRSPSKDGQFLAQSPFFTMFAKLILQAWAPRDKIAKDAGEDIAPPTIILYIRDLLAQNIQNTSDTAMSQPESFMDMGIEDFATPSSMTMPGEFVNPGLPYAMGMMQGGFPMARPDMYAGMPGQGMMDFRAMKMRNWAAFATPPGWGGY